MHLRNYRLAAAALCLALSAAATSALPQDQRQTAPPTDAFGVNAGAQFVTGNSRLIAITGGGKIELRRGDNCSDG